MRRALYSPEVDDGQWSPAAGIVDDVPDDALDVAVPLAVVDRPEPRCALAVLRVGLEDRPRALPLRADNAAHLGQLLGRGELTVRVILGPVQAEKEESKTWLFCLPSAASAKQSLTLSAI